MLRLAIDQNDNIITPHDYATLGEIANGGAARESFRDYIQLKAANTLRRHKNDLTLFASFFTELAGKTKETHFKTVATEIAKGLNEFSGDLISASENLNPAAFQGITWGIVKKFRDYLLSQGYAINTINAKLSTIKIYCGLAAKAQVISEPELFMIKQVSGFAQREGKRVDEKRETTRVGHKKAAALMLTSGQAKQLKNQPATPQGQRDRLLMCLLIEHGLRVSEVAILNRDNLDFSGGVLEFYRPKTDNRGKHELTRDTLLAVAPFAAAKGPLVVASVKGGRLSDRAMTERAINKRVRFLAKRIGIDGLSPHDCRHYAATRLAHQKNIKELMNIFGWTSAATAARYIEASDVAKLD